MLETQRTAPVALIFTALCLQGILLQHPGSGAQRKPFLERFRRLEEQFRRFQEVTLMRLQEIAGNYNISYNISARFDHLLQKQNSLELVANETWVSTQAELRRLQMLVKKLQKKGQKQKLKLQALGASLRARGWQDGAGGEPPWRLPSNFTQQLESHREDLRAMGLRQQSLQRTLGSLRDALQRQGSELRRMEQLLRSPKQEGGLPSPWATAQLLSPGPPEEEEEKEKQKQKQKEPEAAGRQGPPLKMPRAKPQQQKRLQQESRGEWQGGSPPGQALGSEGPREQSAGAGKPSEGETRPGGPWRPGARCNIEAMLVFPNASTENFAAFQPGFQTGLQELSLCSWVKTSASYLGTILSYATEENDNKLVLHGRDVAPRNSVHFVIGDPAFRELPVGQILDGKWHHVCIIWSSLQGRYWFYVDRRLASLGSNFRKGYEIPPQGSLLLGQEQDTVGGGFEPSESFVGFLAGFAIWGRALLPGEVSGIALGKGQPHGALLTLANVSMLGGSVEKVDCACLEHCL